MSSPSSDDNSPRSNASFRSMMWQVLKWALCIVVVVFVARRALELWQQDDVTQFDIKPAWLILAGLFYWVGWLPSVWFWRQLLDSLGQQVSPLNATRAYYCGHLGKYVPGKATVLIIRAALLKNRGARPTAAALTATYETLAMMGIGLAVAAALLPTVFSNSNRGILPQWLQPMMDSPMLLATIVVGFVVLVLPVVARVLSIIAVKFTPADLIEPQSMNSQLIDVKLLGLGSLAFVVAWSCHGLSLGCTLASISSSPISLSQWPVWTAAVSLATSVGFFAIFAPGGVGVREGFLIEVLRIQPEIGEQQAVAAAVLLRFIWFTTEIVSAIGLYYGVYFLTSEKKSPAPINESTD